MYSGCDYSIYRVVSVKTMPVLRKPGMLFSKPFVRAAIVGIFLPVVALSACTSLKVSSTEDVKALAGTYQASGVLSCCPPSFLFETLVIHEDGSYELSGHVNEKGTIKAEGGHIKIGPFDLSVYDQGKHRVLQGNGLGTQVTFGRKR